MITDKVIGVYAAVSGLTPAKQAEWYDKVASDMGVNTFEIPFFTTTAVAPEFVEVFIARKASLVVTLVAQSANEGQKNRSYGLSSTDEAARQVALVDAISIVQQCLALAQKGIRIRNMVFQTGQRIGETVPHAIAFYRSLSELRTHIAAVLPDTKIAVEPADCRPADHPIAFPGSKKSSLNLTTLIQTLTALNQEPSGGAPIGLMVNWGRLIISGETPSAAVQQILESKVPLTGVMLSGAGATKDGWKDSHNSHLDPESGFTPQDARACAAVLRGSSQPIFLGMKCSRFKGSSELTTEEVLKAEAKLLQEIA